MLQRLQTIKNIKVSFYFINFKLLYFKDKKASQGAKEYNLKQKDIEDKKDKLRRKRAREQIVKNYKKKGGNQKD